jgi:L-aminopeptidase/D-esterase-like protein
MMGPLAESTSGAPRPGRGDRSLDPVNLVDRVDGILLAGGSAFGLDAVGGVVKNIEENGRGF